MRHRLLSPHARGQDSARAWGRTAPHGLDNRVIRDRPKSAGGSSANRSRFASGSLLQWLISCSTFTCADACSHRRLDFGGPVAERVLPGEFHGRTGPCGRERPYHYRRALLDSNTDFPRAKAWVKVLDTAAEKSGWGKNCPREPPWESPSGMAGGRASRDHHLHGGFPPYPSARRGRSGWNGWM